MNRADAIRLWLTWSDDLIDEIERGSRPLEWAVLDPGSPLKLRGLDPLVHVKIAAYLVALTAVLDYTAIEIVERYGLKPNNVYFPIECKDPAGFEGKMNRMFPGLGERDPKLYETLRGIQPYQGDQCGFLRQLKRLVNDNKHLHLSPMEEHKTGYRITEDELQKYESRGSSAPGSFLSLGTLVFEGTDVRVVPLLRRCRQDVETVLNALAPFGLP